MTTYQQALAFAAAAGHWAVNMCDNFVANCWGFSASGYNTALDNWNASPSKHAGDMNAPAGALMYWGGGDGHVAISNGDGTIWSTDISGAGTVTRVPASLIAQRWGKPYLGWAPPFFQGRSAGAVGPGGSTGPTPPPAPVVLLQLVLQSDSPSTPVA